jgi:uncharacterized protein (TIGR01319 family)
MLLSKSHASWGDGLLEAILATDVGSTTTKAILLERQPSGWRLTGREEAPTTVEAPFEDVTVGILQAVSRLEKVTGRRMLDQGEVVAPRRGPVGVDLFISTSSAGGGLQMVSAGLVRTYSAGSAERAALGAGAIVSRTLTILDAGLSAGAIDLIRRLRPDIVLLCGGTDGGNVGGVVSLAEYLAVADPRPRVGGGRLPVVFAGNPAARDSLHDVLGERFTVSCVDNVRPDVAYEVLEPARREVHRVFLEHVMSRAPGYSKLLEWSSRRLEPTPRAVGTMMEMFARRSGIDLLGIDIGGATTDIFSVLEGRFQRSVSANLGLSYSAGNVLQAAGVDAVLRWLPYPVHADDALDAVYNKMVRPTTLPETTEELLLEHALAREAARLAIAHHREYLRPQTPRPKHYRSFAFPERPAEPRLRVGALIGSGGPLCHAPRRVQAELILLDAAEIPGKVDLYVDSVFMMPHLGVLAGINPEIALEVFERDCLVRLGTALAADLPRWMPGGLTVATVSVSPVDESGGPPRELSVRAGEIAFVPLAPAARARVEIFPKARVDFGRGPGRLAAYDVDGGEVGLVIDVRGRPIRQVSDGPDRMRQLAAWFSAAQAYPGYGPPEAVNQPQQGRGGTAR